MYFDAGPTLKEKTVAAAKEFIRNHVPVRTQAQFEALLATNEDLAIELIEKWRALEDLRRAYRRLQIETADRNRAIMPVFHVGVDSHPRHDQMATYTVVQYTTEPFRMSMVTPDRAMMNDPEIDFYQTRDAFKRYFDEKVMPHLWKSTENELFRVLQIAKEDK